jgi:predicted sulfurtransferase
MRKPWCVGTIVFLACCNTLSVVASTTNDTARISEAEIGKMLERHDVIIVDARSNRDLDKSDFKIKGAVREYPREIESHMDKFPRTKTLIFYCT